VLEVIAITQDDLYPWTTFQTSSKRRAAGAGVAREPAAAPQELSAKPSSEPPVAPPIVEGGLIATIARIEVEISALDKQREALKMAVEILRQRSGATTE